MPSASVMAAIWASQNDGVAYPSSAPVRTTKSAVPSARRAASTPSASPPALESANAVVVSNNVAGSRSLTTSTTGRPWT